MKKISQTAILKKEVTKAQRALVKLRTALAEALADKKVDWVHDEISDACDSTRRALFQAAQALDGLEATIDTYPSPGMKPRLCVVCRDILIGIELEGDVCCNCSSIRTR